MIPLRPNIPRWPAWAAKYLSRLFSVGLAVVALLVLLVPVGEAAGSSARWYTALIEEGETTQGFNWAVGAKVPKHKPLDQICVLEAVVAPPEEGAPYAEGGDSTICGSLSSPANGVSARTTFGSSGEMLLASLYRPVVRKVSLLLSNGAQKSFSTHVPRIPNRAAIGVPSFRYLVVLLPTAVCVRSVTTFNEKGGIVSREGEPCRPES